MGDFYHPVKNEDGVYEWSIHYTELDGFVANAGKNIVNRI